VKPSVLLNGVTGKALSRYELVQVELLPSCP
jgi:hypothetical protein